MTKAQLIEENEILKKALQQILEIDAEDKRKEIRQEHGEMTFPYMCGVMTARAEIALEKIKRLKE